MTPRRAGPAFWAGAFALGLAVLAAERAVLAAAFRSSEPVGDVLGSFIHGLRFDAAGLVYPLGLAFLVCTALGAWRRSDGGAVRGAAVALGFVAIVAAVEVPFFREFRVRLDFVALEYLDDPGEAFSLGAATVGAAGLAVMAACVAAATWACVAVLRRVRDATLARAPGRPDPVGVLVVAAALFVAGRGGLGRPIRPQDACRSVHPLVNQLDLSGPMTLLRHAYEWTRDRDGPRISTPGMSDAEADELVHGSPLSGTHPRLFEVTDDDGRRALGANVVIVLMESFAARHTGVCGAKGGDAWTPRFDALIEHPPRDFTTFPFLNFWAAGPSTNRAVPAVFASFPPLPSRLALTKSAAGQQDFRALPRILGELGYDSCFVAGGAEEWENLGGWLRQQGFASLVGRADFAEPWCDAPWGPPDAVLLDRVLAECDARASKGKFLVAALTTTNHPPFPVPDDALGRSVSGKPDRERAMRYADAAIGRFMDAALARPWAKDTIFLLLGDHGFHESPQAEIDPDRYRVPLLVVQPKDRAMNVVRTYHKAIFDGWDRPASQVDVVPIVLRFVAPKGTRYASWGAEPETWLPEDDARIVVLGPHGGEPVAAALDGRGNYLVERLDGGTSRLFRLIGGDVREPRVREAQSDDPAGAGHFVPDPASERAAAERAKEPPWPNGRLFPHSDPEAEARLRRYLRAYLSSAQRVLASRNAGGR